MLEVIGKGSFGTVRKVRQKCDGKILVRKEIEYTLMNTHERNQLISELRILRELDHPNIVRYFRHDHIAEQKMIHIYMEYCDGGDLAHVVMKFKRNKERVPEELVWQVLTQTLLALHRCHYGIEATKVNLYTGNRDREPSINSETVVIHRDIKPDNIFLHNGGQNIKVGDFGLAKMITSRNDFAKTYVGTPYYMSPEVLMDEPYTPVCDIWSLGCVLYELCALEPPFIAKTHMKLQEKIRLGTFPELPDYYSPHLRSIINDCITVDTNVRPSCYKLLETLSVRFLRKEMELKEMGEKLACFQDQLASRSDELKRRDTDLRAREEELQALQQEWRADVASTQKNFDARHKALEHELIEEFELRKRSLRQEAEEVRLGYQREFRMVVDKEVQQKLREIQKRGGSQFAPSTSSKVYETSYHSQPIATYEKYPPHSNNGGAQARNVEYLPLKPRGPRELSRQSPQHSRPPLKTRNYDDTYVENTYLPGYEKKRLTDALEKLTIERRHTPEFEEHYLRSNSRY